MAKRRTHLQWTNILVQCDRLTTTEIVDREYVASRILVHADCEDLAMCPATADEIAGHVVALATTIQEGMPNG